MCRKINYEETKNGGGAGKVDTKWNWTIKKEEIHKFMEYLKENPLRGKKKKTRFHLLPKYFKLKEMGAHLAEKESKQFKEWINFSNEWYNINKHLNKQTTKLCHMQNNTIWKKKWPLS